MSDERNDREIDLEERLRGGDPGAFEQFLAVHWAQLVFYITRRVGSVDVAKDIAQESFIRIWERRSDLRTVRSINAYLYQIARNLSVDEHRRREARERWAAGERARLEVAGPGTPPAQPDDGELLAAVEAALATLPERRREAVTLVHLHKLSYREAAEVMGNTPQTVANQVAAALSELRRLLRTFVEDPSDRFFSRRSGSAK